MLPSAYQLPTGLILVVVGLFACFAGYRLFRVTLTIYGFLLGALFASTLVTPADTVATLVVLAVGGLLGAAALYMGYMAGVGLVGAGLGAAIVHGAWLQWRGSEPGMIAWVFGAVFGAAVAMAMQRGIVIVGTAFLGAQTAVAGAVALLASRAAPHAGPDDVWAGHMGIARPGRQWTFLAWVALGLVGALVQYRAGGKPSSRRR